MEPQERRILASTCLGHFLAHFNMLVFPALALPVAQRTGLDLPAVLQLAFWQYLLFGVTALGWGLAADRWGPRKLFHLFFLGSAACGLGAALSLDRPGLFTLSLAGLGTFSGIYHPVGLGILSKSVKRLSLALGYNGMFGNLGLAAAPFLAGLINWSWGPRTVYFVLAGVNLAGFALSTASVQTAETRTAKDAPAGERKPWGPFLLLLSAMMLIGVVYRGASVTLPPYLELRSLGMVQALRSFWPKGVSENLVATTLVSLMYAVGIGGQYAGGRLSDRFDARKVFFCFHLATVPAAFLLAWTSDLPLALSGVVFLFFLLGGQPAENTLVARLSPASFRHSAYGLKFVLVFGVGSLSVKLAGFLTRTRGLGSVFPALGAVSIVVLCLLALLIYKTRHE